MMDARRAAVAAMLGARSVAVVGASPKTDSFGARMIVEAQRGSARMHLVNPRYNRIGDVRCVPTLADLDEPVDLVLLGVPDAMLVGQLEAAAEAGARSAVLFGSAHGVRDKVAEISSSTGMALCGPGCMGFVDNATGVRALGYLEPDPVPAGGVSLISHSGSAFSTLLRAGRGFGYRLAVSSGQELVTDAADYVGYALDDPGTTLIALLLETPRGVSRLRRELLRAHDRGIPVVVLPVGGSPVGGAMVAAHSGALAAGDAAWQAFCESVGAVRVRDLAEFTDTVELFEQGRRPNGRGSGIATVHDSGAERALTADLADQLGVPFAELEPATLDALTDLLDEGLVAANPLDVWGTGADTRALFRACIRLLADDPEVAVTALAVDLVTEFDGDTAYSEAILDAAAASDRPLAVLASLPSAVDTDTASMLRDNGIAVLEGHRSGLAALGHLARWPRFLGTPVVRGDEVRRRRWLERLGPWEPGSAYELLADYGVDVVATTAVTTATDALAAAGAIGYPVALKTLAADHKSELGGVVLGIGDDGALYRCYDEMSSRLGPRATVSAMAGNGVELSIGLVRDAAFGVLLVVAAGGTLVEVLVDRAVAVPPLTRNAALELLRALRIRPLLDGWRGAPAVHLEALVDVIVAFSTMAIELGDAVDAIEANPVIASATGATAVDALVVPRA